jgi:hypothetical protein
MNEDSDDSEKTDEQWAAFQRIWTDTFAKMMQLGFTYSPEAAPPEFLRQIRTGIFQALSQSWDQFLRSPQFLESAQHWMENAVSFRKMSNDFFSRIRHETQGTARGDVDGVLQALQQIETRILDRVEELAGQVEELKSRAERKPTRGRTKAKGKTKARVKKRKASR